MTAESATQPERKKISSNNSLIICNILIALGTLCLAWSGIKEPHIFLQEIDLQKDPNVIYLRAVNGGDGSAQKALITFDTGAEFSRDIFHPGQQMTINTSYPGKKTPGKGASIIEYQIQYNYKTLGVFPRQLKYSGLIVWGIDRGWQIR